MSAESRGLCRKSKAERSEPFSGEAPSTQHVFSALSSEEIERYSRQLILNFWSEEKQLALNKTSVGLSKEFSETALYLAGAGFGKIFLEEPEESLLKKCQALNPTIEVSPFANQKIDATLCPAKQESSLEPHSSSPYQAYFEQSKISLKLADELVATTLSPRHGDPYSVAGLLFASSLLRKLA